MKKIKISQLPLCSTLKGLFTMGTDKDNRSVKVSLEFIEEETNSAVKKAEAATTAAQTATEQTIAALARIIPTGLEIVAMERITLGNSELNRIEATLTPKNTMPNIIFISDNKAVKVDPQGYVRVVGIGESEVHIIPTCNTALAKTIIIRVEAPTARLVNTRKMFRFTESGAIRLN